MRNTPLSILKKIIKLLFFVTAYSFLYGAIKEFGKKRPLQDIDLSKEDYNSNGLTHRNKYNFIDNLSHKQPEFNSNQISWPMDKANPINKKTLKKTKGTKFFSQQEPTNVKKNKLTFLPTTNSFFFASAEKISELDNSKMSEFIKQTNDFIEFLTATKKLYLEKLVRGNNATPYLIDDIKNYSTKLNTLETNEKILESKVAFARKALSQPSMSQKNVIAVQLNNYKNDLSEVRDEMDNINQQLTNAEITKTYYDTLISAKGLVAFNERKIIIAERIKTLVGNIYDTSKIRSTLLKLVPIMRELYVKNEGDFNEIIDQLAAIENENELDKPLDNISSIKHNEL